MRSIMIRMTVLCIIFLCIKDGTCGSGSNSEFGRFGSQRLLNELSDIKALLMTIKEQGILATKLQPIQTPIDTEQDVTGVTEVPGCDQATDLVSGISDSDITATSSSSEPFDSRLNSTSWAPSSPQAGEYLQFDFTTSRTFVGISTGGVPIMGYFVKSYSVSFSSDCQTYSNISQTFEGISTAAVQTINLTTPIVARCIRISPLTWNAIALKVGLLGC